MSAILSNSIRKLDFSNKEVSLEMIDFQKDNFGMKLEETISVIYDKLTTTISATDKKYVSEDIAPELIILTDLIFNRLGLKVKFITDAFMLTAAIIPFYSNQNHIFLNEYYRGNVDEDNHIKFFKKIKDRKELKGKVDTENVKVSGIFSEFENELYMNFKHLITKDKLTVQEVTAVLLHELGHGFYACEYSNRLETNNQILANMSEQLFSKKENKDLVYIYRELKKINSKITESDVEDIVSGKNIIPGLTLFKVLAGDVKNQLTNEKYNQSSFEQLADNFSNRFGYGRPLVSGLQKLTFYNKSLIYLFSILLTINYINDIFYIILALASGSVSVIILLYKVLILLVCLFVSGEGMTDYTYDNIIMRYKRIRNDLVEGLKDKNIPKETSLRITKNIEELDGILLNMSLPEGIFKKLVNLTISFHTKAKASVNEQQLMEELISNDLFIKAAQLKNI